MDWIVAPHSPSMPDFLPVVRRMYPEAKTITANSGITVFRPDYYYLGDLDALGLWRPAAREAQAAGTQLVTAHKPLDILQKRDLHWFDIFLKSNPGDYPKNYIPGRYVGCRFSRLYCMQFALENKASRIVLLGMEGYPGREAATILKTIADFVRSCIVLRPDVRFDVCGELNYELPDTPNLRRFAIPEAVTA